MRRIPRTLSIAAVVIASFAPAIGAAGGQSADAGEEKMAFRTALPNAPGQELTSIVVSYAPGAKSPAHRHAGSVYAYVLTGAIRSENSATGLAKVYRAGESFFEPPGSTHLVSENASVTEPASLLAVFVAPDGAVLTAPAN